MAEEATNAELNKLISSEESNNDPDTILLFSEEDQTGAGIVTEREVGK